MSHYEKLNYLIPREKGRWGITVKKGTYISVRVEDLQKSSDVKVTKICDYCGEESENKITYREINKARKLINKDCCNKVECVGEKISEAFEKNVDDMFNKKINGVFNGKSIRGGLSLAEKFPNITEEYHPTLNDKPPEKILYGSDKLVWWICRKNKDHIWDDSPKHRTGKEKRGCPYCSGARVNHTNSLKTLYPDLILEWHPTMNGELKPNDITSRNSRVVWWLCPDCNSPYDMPVSSRTDSRGGQNCPYCRNLRVNHTNCLNNTYPTLSEEWNYELNIDKTPMTVTGGHCTKVWWTCKVCDEHWLCSPDTRTNMNSGCPKCNETLGEQRVSRFLETNNIKFSRQYSIDGVVGVRGGLLEFDFVVFDKNKKMILIIEYDEPYHFVKITPENQFDNWRIHDKTKDDYCKNNNIEMLRIPYWDYNNVENILGNNLQKVYTYELNEIHTRSRENNYLVS